MKKQIQTTAAFVIAVALCLTILPYDYRKPMQTKRGVQLLHVTQYHFVLDRPDDARTNFRRVLFELTTITIGFAFLLALSYPLTSIQKAVVVVGVASAIGMACLPPWREIVVVDAAGTRVIYDRGYHWAPMFAAAPANSSRSYVEVNAPRLYLHLGAAILATTALTMLVKQRARHVT